MVTWINISFRSVSLRLSFFGSRFMSFFILFLHWIKQNNFVEQKLFRAIRMSMYIAYACGSQTKIFTLHCSLFILSSVVCSFFSFFFACVTISMSALGVKRRDATRCFKTGKCIWEIFPYACTTNKKIICYVCSFSASTLGRSYVHHHDDIVESPTIAQLGAQQCPDFFPLIS